MNPPSSFTAAQIAAALGSSRQAVQRSLAAVPEHGKVLARGNEAATWTVASLPAPMLAKLNRRAKAKGYRHAEHLLSEPPTRYESPVPVNQLSGPVQERARKLRAALARPLAEQAQGAKGEALETFGLQEYKRVVGHEIKPRHWRELLKRTIERDAGEGQWQRLDLYLDGRPHVAIMPRSVKTSPALREVEMFLLGYAAEVRDPVSPTNEEKAFLWNMAFEEMLGLIEGGMKESAARRAVRRVLWKCAVTMAKNEITFNQLWRVKEATWRDANGDISALQDGRALASGNHRTPEIPKEDLDIVIAWAVRYHGRVSQAWRHALEHRLLSREVQSYYETFWHASKSYVPRTVREAVRHEVRLVRDIHHGPRTAKLGGAFINRDWSKVAAGDWYQADDVTLNNYYYAPDGQGGFALMRGQVLLMIDVRSTCILGFAILDQRNYTSLTIRSLITMTCDEHGICREGFYFEGATWENSKVLKGDAKPGKNDITDLESERGLLELGLRFVHSRNPRSKPVERVIGQLQELLEGQPGDAGRDEMKDGFERVKEHKRLVESGKAPASKYFYSYDQWTERVYHFCEEYNNARNDGKMTRGLTPLQAWKNYQADPLVKLPAEARYLLSHHKRPILVGRNGITLLFGKTRFNYRNAETGKLVGQKVLAWFNPDLPELLTVTDMNRENCFTVERSEDLPAMDAPKDMLEREMGRVAAHNGYARHRYRVLAKIANLNGRPDIVDFDTAKLGQEMAEQQQEILAKRQASEKRVKAGRAVMKNLGIAPRPDDEITPEQITAAKFIQQAREEFLQGKTK